MRFPFVVSLTVDGAPVSNSGHCDAIEKTFDETHKENCYYGVAAKVSRKHVVIGAGCRPPRHLAVSVFAWSCTFVPLELLTVRQCVHDTQSGRSRTVRRATIV